MKGRRGAGRVAHLTLKGGLEAGSAGRPVLREASPSIKEIKEVRSDG